VSHLSESREPDSGRHVVIVSGTRVRFDWRELYLFRELFLTLAWRDISVKYKQTLFGFAWVLLRPLLTIAVFTVVFGVLAKVPPVGDIPYPLVVCGGLLPWYLISLSLTDASSSLVSNSAIVTKVYFPRLILPITALMANFADFVVSLLILIALMAWYGFGPVWQILFLPIWVIFALLIVLGPGLLFAALNAEYRDFRYIVPFIVQLGLYISPVGFSSAIVPDSWQLLYSLNPAVGIIEGFRWCFFGDRVPIFWPSVGLAAVFGLIFLWIGYVAFAQAERKLADVI